MSHFRKKPVVIEAVQLDGTEEAWYAAMAFVGGAGGAFNGHLSGPDRCWFYIDTLEGQMTAKNGDWIIKGVNGEFYPCKPDIFAATYEPAGRAPQPVDAGGDVDWDQLESAIHGMVSRLLAIHMPAGKWLTGSGTFANALSSGLATVLLRRLSPKAEAGGADRLDVRHGSDEWKAKPISDRLIIHADDCGMCVAKDSDAVLSDHQIRAMHDDLYEAAALLRQLARGGEDAPPEPAPERYVVLKASGSRYAYVNDTQEGRTVKRYDVLKGSGQGWEAAHKHARQLNAALEPKP